MVDDDEQEPAAGRRRRWPWRHPQTTRTRRIVRTTLALLVTGLLSAVAGALTASTDSSLGPHAAHYSVTPPHQIVVDLGPLAQGLLDSTLHWTLRLVVVVAA